MMPILESILYDDRIELAKKMIRYNKPIFKIMQYSMLDEFG